MLNLKERARSTHPKFAMNVLTYQKDHSANLVIRNVTLLENSEIGNFNDH